MTYEEKKEFLRSYRVASLAAKDAAERLREYRARHAGLKAVILSDMPKGGSTPRDLSDYVAGLDEMEGRLLAAIDRYHDQERIVAEAIARASDPVYERLLRLRYLDFMTFEQIADRMDYSWRQIMRLHYYAVMALDIKMS